MSKWDKLDRYFWILFVGLVVYDLVKSGTDGMIEMVTDPVFYIIIFFLVLFKAFWYNEMNKYGLPVLRKSRNHGIVKF